MRSPHLVYLCCRRVSRGSEVLTRPEELVSEVLPSLPDLLFSLDHIMSLLFFHPAECKTSVSKKTWKDMGKWRNDFCAGVFTKVPLPVSPPPSSKPWPRFKRSRTRPLDPNFNVKCSQWLCLARHEAKATEECLCGSGPCLPLCLFSVALWACWGLATCLLLRVPYPAVRSLAPSVMTHQPMEEMKRVDFHLLLTGEKVGLGLNVWIGSKFSWPWIGWLPVDLVCEFVWWP